MKITVLGTGYVGLITGVCFANQGHDVTCVDLNLEIVNKLNHGIPTIHEEGLPELLARVVSENKINFVDHFKHAPNDTEVIFLCVGTPQGSDGAANLEYIFSAAEDIGRHIQKDVIIVDKSTVPVGTSEKVTEIVAQYLQKDLKFEVVSNPEFLREGKAIEDFMNPDRVVIGAKTSSAVKTMSELYRPFVKNDEQLIIMNPQEAEMTKYAANALLATKISFMNEIANLCDHFDIDVEQVKHGVGTDHRISDKFLNPGCGYGGSCFPKDVNALIHTADTVGFNAKLLQSVLGCNRHQKYLLFKKLRDYFNNSLEGKVIAVWGLAFKPGTDDMREASSLVFIKEAVAAGCNIQAFDPVAHETAMKIFSEQNYDLNKITLADTAMSALEDADALVIITEWPEFKSIELEKVKQKLKGHVIFDGRNIFVPQGVADLGLDYIGIGRSRRVK